tara:strand:- start:1081 stop:1329 length:249 start_codon:yes stop_codon:yes gene_type:complete
MVFSKQISLGQVLTIVTISFSLFFALGSSQNRIEYLEKDNEQQSNKILQNDKNVRDLQIEVTEIKIILSDRFNRLEDLIIDN